MKQIWFSDKQTQKLQIIEKKKENRSDLYSKEMNIRGVGFKAWSKDKHLYLDVGYTHYISVEIPDEVTGLVRKTRMVFSAPRRGLERLGSFTSSVRAIKTPDAYKGKGIRYKEEVLKCKVGKVKT